MLHTLNINRKLIKLYDWHCHTTSNLHSNKYDYIKYVG